MKVCIKCKQEKSYQDYHRDSTTSDGYNRQCKICSSTASKNRYQINKEVHKTRSKQYKQQNIEAVKKYEKTYYQQNKVRLIKQGTKYKKERRLKDPTFKLLMNLRIRQGCVLKGKTTTTGGLGCTSDFLRTYIEDLWQMGMDWTTYGHGKAKWCIDHIQPLTSYEKALDGSWKTDSDYNRKLLHYTNMQPMWFDENLKKSNKILK